VSVKVGDVNNSASPSNFDEGEGTDRTMPAGTEDALIFNTEDIELVAGHEYAVPFMVAPAAGSVAGFQFTLDFDEKILDFLAVNTDAGSLLDKSNFGTPDETGQAVVTVSWNNYEAQALPEGKAIFTLKFRAKNSALLSDVLHLNSRYTPAEAYRVRSNLGSFQYKHALELLGVSLAFEHTTGESLQLYQNSPNPFWDKTTIGFYLPKASPVTFRLYDVYGQLLKRYEDSFPQGANQLDIELTDLPVRGVLFCTITVEGFQQKTVKMIRNQ
jgi:hypothetical protein